MDTTLQSGVGAAMPYDYRQYDRVWQRVGPSLNPYPGGAMAGMESGTASPGNGTSNGGQTSVQAEENLPGAEGNPCCMGSAAMDDLEVLEGFIEEELADRRYYLAFSCRAPAWARQTLRDVAADEGEHARRLLAVYYLITGRCYPASVSCDRIYIGGLCAALRERYHGEACGGLNYIRAAEGTTDPCLAKILTDLSADEYRHAEQMTALLERALSGGCNGMRLGV